MVIIGKIKVWIDYRGFGFIVTEGDSPDIFVHISEIDYQPVRPGDIVSFELQFDPKGRPLASNVRKAPAELSLSRWDEIPEVKAKKAQEIFSEAIVARDNKEYHRARDLFEKAIAMFPSKNFFQAYAAMEKHLGNWDRVRAIYDNAVRFFPEDPSILMDLAMAERRAGNLDKCVSILRSAVDKYPDNHSLCINLAQSLVEIAEKYQQFDVLDEARKLFDRVKLFRHFHVEERSHYHKMWILYQRRSRLAWLMLQQAGFTFVRWRVTLPERGSAPVDGWVLINPLEYRYSELYGLNGNVLLYFYYGPQVTESIVCRAEETLKQLVENDPKIKPDLLFLVVPELKSLEHYLRALLEDPESHPTVIPIDEQKAGDILNNYEAIHSYLEQLLSEWVFRRDLYKGNFPVSGRRFFGREREIQLLNQSINDGRPVGIFGLRKSGKTSLLYQLRLIHKENLVAYIDPEASPIEDCTWLCWKAVQEWGDRSRKQGLRLIRYQIQHNLPDFQEVLPKFAADLHTLMSALPAEARLILMIDEIEKVIPVQGEGWAHSFEMFRFLRGMVQQSAGRFTVLVAGANPAICEMAQWGGEDNPMFQFFEEMFLPLLSESECTTMIVSLGKGMGIEWDEDALHRVYRLTGGHPYITRRVCSTLINRFRERPLRVTVDMVKQAQPELIMRSLEIFEEIKQRLRRDYPEEWEVLEALAYGFPLDEVKQLVPGWARALKHLEGYQLIEFIEGEPRFKMELLYKWIRGEES
jgi:cold shock CspA family protein